MLETAIQIENLRFGYGGPEVLHGISFSVRRGEVTGLLGPNGAGKSTTLKILSGILKFNDGHVTVEGFSLPDQAFDVKKVVGYVPESAELYETISAIEFLELCGRLHELEEKTLQARIAALLEGFGLSAQGRQRLGSVSKGMRQKVLISAALLHFSSAPQRGKASRAGPLVILSLIGAFVIVGLQWLFIFQSRSFAFGATAVFGGAAFLISRTSLQYLETNVLHSLHALAAGRTAMFKEI
jgi:ABC-type transport system involved in cytochrome c biogenesis ATPase subunit